MTIVFFVLGFWLGAFAGISLFVWLDLREIERDCRELSRRIRGLEKAVK